MHIPVLLSEVLEALKPKNGGTYLDCTFGAGGYSRAILDSCNCNLIALDRDPNVSPTARSFSEVYGSRFTFHQLDFGSLEALSLENIDGVVMDIGVSSMQLDNADRGFSFQKPGPLDMRMDPQIPTSAADIVNSYTEEELANIIYQFGDERFSRRIARAINLQRQKQLFSTTTELADCIKSAIGRYNDQIHPATRTFQALRIFINDELNQLQNALKAAKNILGPGGRLVLVTFHSGEDRLAKRYFNELTGKAERGSDYFPFGQTQEITSTEFKLVYKKAVLPSDQETRENPRARSAKLRAIERIC